MSEQALHAQIFGTAPEVVKTLMPALLEAGFQVALESAPAEPPDLLILGPDALAQGTEPWREKLQTPSLCLGPEPGSEEALVWLTAGALHCLALPLNESLWQTRLTCALRIIDRHRAHRQELGRHNAELEVYRATVAREQEVARGIFSNLLRSESIDHIKGLRWQLDERALCHGDLILATKAPSGSLHLLVGDFPDRGLVASICAMTVTEIFYTMTDKGFELIDIVQELNRRLRRLLPGDTAFSVCLVAIDPSGQQAQVWNGGLPPLLIHQAATNTWKGLEPQHQPLGILPDEQLGRAMRLVSLEHKDRLLLHTHSLRQQLPQAIDDLPTWLNSQALLKPEEVFDHFIAAAGPRADEDPDADYRYANVSLLEYLANHDLQPLPDTRESNLLGKGISTRWNYELQLDADGLRSFDPRPMLTQLLVEVQGLQEHREKIYTIIAELYSNALEHGLLELDSQMKSSPEGFAQYYLEREMRLAALEHGLISFRLSHQPKSDGGILGIEIEDSGKGFDFKKQGLGELKRQGYSGRGIGLVRSLARRLEYFPPGNRVRISYHWQHF